MTQAHAMATAVDEALAALHASKARLPEFAGVENRLRRLRVELSDTTRDITRLSATLQSERAAAHVERRRATDEGEAIAAQREAELRELSAEMAERRAEIVGVQNETDAARQRLEALVREIKGHETAPGTAARYRALVQIALAREVAEPGALLTEMVNIPRGWHPSPDVEPLNDAAVRAFYAAGPGVPSAVGALRAKTFWTVKHHPHHNEWTLTGLGAHLEPICN